MYNGGGLGAGIGFPFCADEVARSLNLKDADSMEYETGVKRRAHTQNPKK